MKWIKKGVIFKPEEESNWMVTHAAHSFADYLGNDIYRIYFATRDKENRSHTAFIDINVKNPKEILNISKKPVLAPGEIGTFDDSGVMPSWITNHNNCKYLYYIGWSLGVTVPFRNSTGLAISYDKGHNFKRYSRGPILHRTNLEPHWANAPCVMIENGKWRLWYLSCLKWGMENGKAKHYYHIKYAESKDGINWKREGIVCIDFKSKEEYAISRPCVIKEDGIYKMWYSYRGETYRIGYAESKDGIKWERKDDEVGIDVSESGWDSEMIEYPFVFNHNCVKYMLYNGNSYGKTGLGYAILGKK